MDLKQKIAKIKEKLNEHSDEIVLATTVLSTFAALGLAYHHKNQLVAERSSNRVQRECLSWIVREIQNEEPKLIKMEGNMIYIKPQDTTE